MPNSDLERALADMAAARRDLLALVSGASAGDLARTRPGGWTLGRVLHHIIESEAVYAKLLAHHYIVNTPVTFDLEPFSLEQRRTQWFDHYRECRLRRGRPPRQPLVAKRARKTKPLKPLGQLIADLARDIPDEEMAKLPRDGAANHDHSIYGTPKQCSTRSQTLRTA